MMLINKLKKQHAEYLNNPIQKLKGFRIQFPRSFGNKRLTEFVIPVAYGINKV
jgi:hypothetical protein